MSLSNISGSECIYKHQPYEQPNPQGCYLDISKFQQQKNHLNEQFNSEQIYISQKEEIFQYDRLNQDKVGIQELQIEICTLTQANIPLQDANYIVPLKSSRFVWISQSQPPQVVEYQIELQHQFSHKNFSLTCLLYFKVENQKDQFGHNISAFSLQLEKVFLAQGFRNLVRELKAKRGDKLVIQKVKAQCAPYFSVSVLLKDSQKCLTETHKVATPTSISNHSFNFGDSLLQNQVDQFMSKEVKKKQGRQYDITILPIITDISQLIYTNYPTQKFIDLLQQNSTDQLQKQQNIGASNVVGPMLMTINQERCQIEFQPSNQVSDFITPLKARGYRWAGKGQAPKSYSVKIVLVDEQGEQWPMTHILKFHPAKTSDSEYPVMRFKISNFLGWRKFNKRWNVTKGDKLQIYKQTTSNKVLIKLSRSQNDQVSNSSPTGNQVFKFNDNLYNLSSFSNSINVSINQSGNQALTQSAPSGVVPESNPSTHRLQSQDRDSSASRSFALQTGNSNQSYTTTHQVDEQPQSRTHSINNVHTNYQQEQTNTDQNIFEVFQQYSQDLQPNDNQANNFGTQQPQPYSNNNSFELYKNFSLQKKDYQSSFDLFKIFTAQKQQNDEEILRRVMQENHQNYQDMSNHESNTDTNEFVDQKVIEHFPSFANEVIQNFMECSMENVTTQEPTQFIERTITNLSDLYI